MHSSRLFSQSNNSDSQASESDSVSAYKRNSEIYKALQNASTQGGVAPSFKETMGKLNDATTFIDMIKSLEYFNIERESFLLRMFIKPALSISSYFSSDPNFSYYALKLREEIVKYSLEKGYVVSGYNQANHANLSNV